MSPLQSLALAGMSASAASLARVNPSSIYLSTLCRVPGGAGTWATGKARLSVTTKPLRDSCSPRTTRSPLPPSWRPRAGLLRWTNPHNHNCPRKEEMAGGPARLGKVSCGFRSRSRAWKCGATSQACGGCRAGSGVLCWVEELMVASGLGVVSVLSNVPHGAVGAKSLLCLRASLVK